MRLHVATVRNYRLHKETTVNFDDALTLIGGPNESGKSTFIEALHRALFFKTRATGAIRDAMESRTHTGHPEVEVTFSAGPHRYTLKKTFGKGVNLLQHGGSSWSGDEAESRLENLLKAESIGGRGAENRIDAIWAHLWVWQGKSGSDPAHQTAAEHTSLLQRLQQLGGAAAVLSERDARIAQHFFKETDALFTDAGAPRTKTDLHNRKLDLEKAEALRTEAARRLALQRETVERYERATTALQTATNALADLLPSQADVLAKLDHVAKLKQDERERSLALNAATERLVTLTSAHTRLSETRERATQLQRDLAPHEDFLRQKRDGLNALKQAEEAAARDHDAACHRTRDAQAAHALATAWLTFLEKQRDLNALQHQEDKARLHLENLNQLRKRLAALPQLTPAKLTTLKKLERAASNAQAILEAAATAIDLLAAPAPVIIDGAPLAPGERRVLLRETQLVCGDLTLRITPGGNLAQARTDAQHARNALQTALQTEGLENLSAGETALTQRNELETQIKHELALLNELAPDQLSAQRKQATLDLEAASAKYHTLAQRLASPALPHALPEARAHATTTEHAWEAATAAENRLKARHEAAATALEDARAAAEKLQAGIEDMRRALQNETTKLDVLRNEYGDPETLSSKRAAAHVEQNDAQLKLAEVRNTLASLQPDMLLNDRDRLKRAVETTQREKADAEIEQARALANLSSDGSTDPAADFALADARYTAAREQLTAAERRAKALRLLNELCTAQRRALSETLSQPLADRISQYLQCVFGPGAKALVTLNQTASGLDAIHLVREDAALGALPFDRLSGGAKEQAAAAVRLAIAELLAPNHHDCLPVVFDDAFAYADPARVKALQRMLDFAARQGLQIIVLTCTPADYATLGAKKALFEKPTAPQPALQAASTATSAP